MATKPRLTKSGEPVKVRNACTREFRKEQARNTQPTDIPPGQRPTRQLTEAERKAAK